MITDAKTNASAKITCCCCFSKLVLVYHNAYTSRYSCMLLLL